MEACEIIKRWESRERPLFKHRLIDENGCCCAQGDVLRCAGKSDEELRTMGQCTADRETARLLGSSVGHAILLRDINDEADGAPQNVLKASGLRMILGPHWRLVMAFWRHLDAITTADWQKVLCGAVGTYAATYPTRAAAWCAAGDAAADVAGAASWNTVRVVTRTAAWYAAWYATMDTDCDVIGELGGDAAWELVGWSKLATPYFLNFFLEKPAEWVAAHENYRPTGIVED